MSGAKTRVGFAIGSQGSSWTGGTNYYVNLLNAVANNPDRRIETVLFVPPDAADDHIARFPADAVVRTNAFAPGTPLRSLGKMLERTISRNPPVEWLLRRERIDVFSHWGPIGPRSPVRTLGWIPDFQEAHLPDFFAARELRVRAAGHRHYADYSTRIVLSSEDARGDLANLYPGALPKARVLRFVSGIGTAEGRDARALRAKYGLPERFFHVPNQLWIHKNHGVIAKALAILKARGIEATVISTGATSDYRHPDVHPRLLTAIEAEGVADRFPIAGLVPFADVAGLLRHCAAVINPSLFEGWSTTVEEAKTLGKRILLSNIPVHIEQAPERGRYFAPHDANALADLMAETLATHDPAEEASAAARAAQALPGRMRAFAQAYEAIVLDAATAPLR